MPFLRDTFDAAASYLGGMLTKSAPPGSGMRVTNFASGYGGGPVDSWGRQRPANPHQLIRELKGIAYACANKNSNAFARVPLKLYVRTGKGEPRPKRQVQPLTRKSLDWLCKSPSTAGIVQGAADVEEVTDHPLLDLLHKPNPYTHGYDLRYLYQLYLEMVGTCYWHLPKNRIGTPAELWFLPAQFVKPFSDDSNTPVTVYQFSGGGFQEDYDPADVLPFRMPTPLEPLATGLSPTRAALEYIGVGDKELATLQATLDNAGRPDVVFTPADVVGPAEAQRATSRYRQIFRRGGNGGLIVMESAGKLTPLSFSPRDLSALEVVGMTKETIAVCFDVPPALIHGPDITYATLDAALEQHAREAILPRVTRFDEALNAGLVPLYDDSGRLFLAHDNPVPEDDDQALKRVQILVGGGIMTPNEARAEQGLDPIDGGDVRLVPSGMEAVGDDGLPIMPEQPDGMGQKEPGKSQKEPERAKPKKSKAARKLTLRLKRIERLLSKAEQTQETKPEDAQLQNDPAAPESETIAPPEAPESQAKQGIDGSLAKSHATILAKSAGPHSYSSTQINFPTELGDELSAWGKANISDADLYVGEEDDPEKDAWNGYGRETEPHITLLYGLHTSDPEDVRPVLRDAAPISLTLGKVSRFDTNPDYDVLKLDVESDELHALNRRLRDNLPHTCTFPKYQPHATIAYVRKGACSNLDGSDAFAGRAFTGMSVKFSPAEGEATELSLGGKPATKALISLEDIGVDPDRVGIVSFSAADVAAAIAVWDAEMQDVAGLLDPTLTKAWTYSTETRRYREDASGRFLGPERMLELRDTFTDRQKAKAADLAARVVTGEIDGQEWERLFQEQLRNSYIDLFVLGRGGRGMMTPKDWSTVGNLLKEQYGWLRAFRSDVEDGDLSEAQIAARSGLYHESATQAYERGAAVAAGVPDTTDLPMPGDSSSECKSNCRCNWSFEDTPDALLCTWNLDPACKDHCETCSARAEQWAPLSVPKDGGTPTIGKSLDSLVDDDDLLDEALDAEPNS